MITHIHSESDLDGAIAALVVADPRWGPVVERSGRPPLRRREGGYAGLAQIIVSQQVSVASAAAIYGRLAAIADPFDHASVLRARRDKLVRVGLSAAKIKTLKSIARAVDSGAIDLAALGNIPADDAHAALTRLHGIGPWTADIYLLACLGHADAWPAGDLALQEAARIAFGLRQRPTPKEMGPLAEGWRPWRAVAARLLWSYYRAVKQREGLLNQQTAKPAAPKQRQSTAKKTAANTAAKKRGKNGR